MNALLTIIISFSKVGLISLGGGNSMLKLLEYEAVTQHHWVAKEEFIRMLGSSFLFPGLTAVKLAGLLGYKVAGIAGLILAITCLNLPGLLLAVFGYAWLSHHDSALARKIMIPVQYGALALLAAATFSVAQGVVDSYFSWIIALSSLAFFFALAFLQMSPFWGFIAFIGVCFFMVN